MLMGTAAIMAYIGVKHRMTFYRWVDKYCFPAVKRPDGVWMSTVTAIDDWIFMLAQVRHPKAEKLTQPQQNAIS